MTGNGQIQKSLSSINNQNLFISLLLTETVVASLEDTCLLVFMAAPTLDPDWSVYH